MIFIDDQIDLKKLCRIKKKSNSKACLELILWAISFSWWRHRGHGLRTGNSHFTVNKSIKGCGELSGKILRSLAKFLIPSILQSPFLKDFIIYPDVIFWDTLKRTKNCLTLGKIRGGKGYIAKSVHSDGYFLKSEHFVKEFSLIFFLSWLY